MKRLTSQTLVRCDRHLCPYAATVRLHFRIEDGTKDGYRFAGNYCACHVVVAEELGRDCGWTTHRSDDLKLACRVCGGEQSHRDGCPEGWASPEYHTWSAQKVREYVKQMQEGAWSMADNYYTT